MTFAFVLAVAVNAAPPPPLTGRWEGSAFILLLEANGTGSIAVASGPADPLTWKAAGQKLSVSQGGETTVYTYAVSGDSLTLSGSDLPAPLKLERKSGGAPKKGLFGSRMNQDSPATAAPVVPAATAPKGTAPAQPKVTGTCQGACTHMLECAGQNTPLEVAQCVQNCSQGLPDPQKLAGVELMSCAQTNAMLLQQAAAQQQRQQRRGGNGRKECQGCVSDGNHCVWLSQSDWGSGNNSPYSGAGADCDPTCCQ